jgi:hypothetical protein
MGLPNGFYVPTHTYIMCFFFEMTKRIILSLGHAKDAWSSPIGQISTMLKVYLELHYLLNG